MMSGASRKLCDEFRPVQITHYTWNSAAFAGFLCYLKHFPTELRSRVVNKSNAQTKSIRIQSAGEPNIRYVCLHMNFVKCKQRRDETGRDNNLIKNGNIIRNKNHRLTLGMDCRIFYSVYFIDNRHSADAWLQFAWNHRAQTHNSYSMLRIAGNVKPKTRLVWLNGILIKTKLH